MKSRLKMYHRVFLAPSCNQTIIFFFASENFWCDFWYDFAHKKSLSLPCTIAFSQSIAWIGKNVHIFFEDIPISSVAACLKFRQPETFRESACPTFTIRPWCRISLSSHLQEGVTRPAPFRRSLLRGNRVLGMLLEGWISMLTSFITASGSVARSFTYAACTGRNCSSLTGSPVLSGCRSWFLLRYPVVISARVVPGSMLRILKFSSIANWQSVLP